MLWLFTYNGERFSNYISQLHQSSAFLLRSLTHDNQEALHSKISLKNCQFCSLSLSLRAVSQAVHAKIPQRTESPKIQSLDFLFACPLRTWSSGHGQCSPGCWKSWHLLLVHLSGPETGLVTLLLLSDCHIKKLSLMHLKSLQDCLQIAVLLFQQKAPAGSMNMVLPCSCSKKHLSTVNWSSSGSW